MDSSASRGPVRLARVVVLLAALAVNVPLLGAGPIYDDHALVVNNPLAHAPVQWRAIFTTGYWSGSGLRRGNEYRPLTVLSFALVDPLGLAAQRAVNGLLHGLVSVLAGEVALLVSGSIAVGLVTGLVFALHPVHADVLGTLVGRGELLAAALGLAAWWAHLTARPRLACAALCAAFLAKESAVVVPALVWLGDRCRGDGKLRVRPWLELVLGLVLAIAIRLVVMGGVLAVEPISVADNPLMDLSTTGRVLSALASFGSALRLAALPAGLMPDRTTVVAVVRSVADLRWTPGAGLLAATAASVVLAVRGSRRARPWALGLGVFVLAYLPVSNLLFPVGTALAERLLYVPSLGVCFAVAVLLEQLPARPRALAGAALVAALSIGSVAAVWPYRSGVALWTRMVEVAPTNAKARVNLVAELTAQHRLDESERAAREAVALDPGKAEFHHALADTLAERGDVAGALIEAREAARLAPGDQSILLGLASLLYDDGQEAEAGSWYRAVAREFPGIGEPWWYLSRIAEHAGDREGALRAMREAARLYGTASEWGRRAEGEIARLAS